MTPEGKNPAWREAAVERYIRGESTIRALAIEGGVDQRVIRTWIVAAGGEIRAKGQAVPIKHLDSEWLDVQAQRYSEKEVTLQNVAEAAGVTRHRIRKEFVLRDVYIHVSPFVNAKRLLTDDPPPPPIKKLCTCNLVLNPNGEECRCKRCTCKVPLHTGRFYGDRELCRRCSILLPSRRSA